MAKEYHKWTAEDISTFWRLKDEGYTLAEIAEKMGLPYTSVKSKSQELIKEKPDKTGQNRTKSDKVKTAETAKQKISNEIESHQTVACLLKEAMILQEKAEFNVSRIMVSLDKGTSVIQINGATENGDSIQLIQIKQKNPLPFSSTMQNEQGTS